MSLNTNKQAFTDALKTDLKHIAIQFKNELKTGDDSVYKIHEEIDNILEPLMNKGGNIPIASIKNQMREVIAEKWSEHLGTLLEKYFELMAEKVAIQVDAYIKTAKVKVTIPIGTVTQGASTAATPNVSPIVISGEPANPTSPGGLS